MMWIAYAAAWISCAAAAVLGAYITKSAWCMWVMMIPALVKVQLKEDGGEGEQDEERT